MSNIVPTMCRVTTDILLWGLGSASSLLWWLPSSTATLIFDSPAQVSLLSLDGLTASVPGCPSARHSGSQGGEYPGSFPPSQLQSEVTLLAGFPIQQSTIYPPFSFSTLHPFMPVFFVSCSFS